MDQAAIRQVSGSGYGRDSMDHPVSSAAAGSPSSWQHPAPSRPRECHSRRLSLRRPAGPASSPSSPTFGSQIPRGAAHLLLAALVVAGAMLGLVAPTHAASDGDLRLEDGPSASYGRLEIFHDGRWGAVCDDLFGSPDATVACHQLGYTEGTRKKYAHPAPAGMGFWLDNLRCAGTESRLDSCLHPGWGKHNCLAREAVSVSCTGLVQSSPLPPAPEPATGVTASNVTGTTVDLAWTLPAQPSGVTVTGVEVQRQSGASWTTVATLAADATSHTVTGLTAGTAYSFRIRLATNNGNADTDAVSATTLGWDPNFRWGYTQLHPNMWDTTANNFTVEDQWNWASFWQITGTSFSPSRLAAGEKANFLVKTYASQNIGSVRLELTGPKNASRTVNTAPYALFDNPAGEALPAGTYRISATAYSGADMGGTAGTTRSATFTLAADTTAPSVRLRCGDDAPTARSFEVGIYFNEWILGFVHSDIAVVDRNGARLAHWGFGFGPVNDSVYSHDVRLTEDVSGQLTVTVPAGVAHDETGNLNTASEPLRIALSRTGSVADAGATEGTDATIDFEVTLDAADDCETATVDWATADGTAVAGEDYTQASGRLTFKPGETTKTVSVVVLDDAVNEGAETFTLRLSNPSGVTLADGEATGTIVDNDDNGVSAPIPANGVTASNATQTTVDLAWTLPAQPSGVTVTGVEVQQQATDASWTTVATLAADATSHTVTGLTAGTAYSFRIRLVTSSGNADTDAVSATTLAVPKPAAGLAASNATQTTVDLSWTLPTQPAGVTMTGVEVQQQSGASWSTVATLAADATSHTVTGLTAGTSYTFRVRLAASSGDADSEPVSVATLAAPVAATGLHSPQQGVSSIFLT